MRRGLGGGPGLALADPSPGTCGLPPARRGWQRPLPSAAPGCRELLLLPVGRSCLLGPWVML